jgi:type II secretory pathway pseudopilin PulG
VRDRGGLYHRRLRCPSPEPAIMRRRCAAFTLVEALFAIVLFFVALGTFLTLLPFALESNAHDSYYLQAVAAGQEYLDSLRDAVENGLPAPSAPVVPIDAGGSVVGNGLNASPGNFSISGGCSSLPTNATLQDCIVNVQWMEGGMTRTYTIESYDTRQVS